MAITKKVKQLVNPANAEEYIFPVAGTASTYNAAGKSVDDLLGDKADLVNGLVPASQLPSYVDDILEYPTFANFPAIGESNKVYLELEYGILYRWTGSTYGEVSQSLALGETSSTAYRGDRGKTAYDHSQLTGNPHGTTAAQVSNTPYGIIEGATVQSAINELATDTEKLNLIVPSLDKYPTTINKLIDYAGSLETNAVLYFDIDSVTTPLLNDFRIRKSGLYLYTERYNGTIWEIVSTTGGSIETDSFRMQGELCSILNIQDETPFNVWRITSNLNGNEFGSSYRDMYLTGSGEDKFFISYNKPGILQYNVELVNTSSLGAGLYNKNVVADKDYEIQYMSLNVDTPTRLRLIVTDVAENRIVYKSNSDADFATNGGVLVKDYITNATTGVIKHKLINVLYLVAGRTYQISFELSEGSINGSAIFPYLVAEGYEFTKDIIASRKWVSEQSNDKMIATGISDVLIKNTTVEGSLIPTLVGSNILPANFLTVGKTVNINIRGILSWRDSDYSTLKIKIGNVELINMYNNAPRTFNDVGFETDFTFTCRSTGVNGVVVGQGNSSIYDGNAVTYDSVRTLRMLSNATVDTTIPLTLDVRYKWASASTSNAIKVTNITIS